MLDRRRETRYIVSEIYDNFMVCKIKERMGEFKPVKLLNVSLSGIQMKSEFELPVGSLIECLICVPKAPIKEILFSAKIIHCIEGEQGKVYIMGGEIINTSEQSWVDGFFRLHDFINESLRTSGQKKLSPVESVTVMQH
jgi:hypothetical protein